MPPASQLAMSRLRRRHDADALLILTDWAEFATLDLDRLKHHSGIPSSSTAAISTTPRSWRQGFTYLSVGRAVLASRQRLPQQGRNCP